MNTLIILVQPPSVRERLFCIWRSSWWRRYGNLPYNAVAYGLVDAYAAVERTLAEK